MSRLTGVVPSPLGLTRNVVAPPPGRFDIVRDVVLYIAIPSVVLGLAVAPRRMCAFPCDPSKAEVAKLLVDSISMAAHDATDHCPTNTELDHGDIDTTDPWGHPVRITCSAAGTRATSAGEDGQLDTADDIEAVRR